MEREEELSQQCQAICRDGTACLNAAHHQGYCWKHKQKCSS